MQMKDPIYCQDGEFNQMPSQAFDRGPLHTANPPEWHYVTAREPQANVKDMIIQECNSIKTLLLDKNSRYGNSALEPIRMFSKANTVEQILVRIDDKLSRLASGTEINDDEDTVQDLIGYLILLRVARRLAK